MRFEDFEGAARAAWERVPSEYKAGISGLVIERDARADAQRTDIYTLGECVTESYPSSFDGPDTTRSVVVLYYGSFLRLSLEDAAFDWDQEIWETLTHELQHHLESLASEDGLEDFDYAVEQNFRRNDGEEFDPLFYRGGHGMQADASGSHNVFRVDDDVFMELPSALQPVLEFEFGGARYRIELLVTETDIVFVRVVSGPVVGGDFWLVLVAPRGPLKVVSDVLRGRRLQVRQLEATAERLGP